MLVFDLFAGTKSSTKAFEDNGAKVISFEMEATFNPTEVVDVFTLEAGNLINKYGKPDFIWASPPCTAFSVASIGKHWSLVNGVHIPKTEKAVMSQELVKHTINLIKQLQPTYGFIIENPRCILRKLPFMQELPRRTVTYCQYGDFRMKPTDLWGYLENWQPRQPCRNGDKCHEAASRGSQTGTQRIKKASIKSMIPYGLSFEIYKAVEKNVKEKIFMNWKNITGIIEGRYGII